MRRPWIKIETSTPDKPEICTIATSLRMDPDTVVGKLVRLWSWAELNHVDANDLGVTIGFLDKLVGRKGFATAMMQAGWLTEAGSKLSLPHFDRHNGGGAKNRIMTAKRVKRHRLRKQARNDHAVTEAPHYDIGEVVITGVESDLKDVNTTFKSHNNNEQEAIHVAPESAMTPIDLIEQAPVIHSAPMPPEEEAKTVASVVTEPPLVTESPFKKRKSKTASESTDQPMLF